MACCTAGAVRWGPLCRLQLHLGSVARQPAAAPVAVVAGGKSATVVVSVTGAGVPAAGQAGVCWT